MNAYARQAEQASLDAERYYHWALEAEETIKRLQKEILDLKEEKARLEKQKENLKNEIYIRDAMIAGHLAQVNYLLPFCPKSPIHDLNPSSFWFGGPNTGKNKTNLRTAYDKGFDESIKKTPIAYKRWRW
jgi:hypothetical protein